jgi:hypothetical protein
VCFCSTHGRVSGLWRRTSDLRKCSHLLSPAQAPQALQLQQQKCKLLDRGRWSHIQVSNIVFSWFNLTCSADLAVLTPAVAASKAGSCARSVIRLKAIHKPLIKHSINKLRRRLRTPDMLASMQRLLLAASSSSSSSMPLAAGATQLRQRCCVSSSTAILAKQQPQQAQEPDVQAPSLVRCAAAACLSRAPCCLCDFSCVTMALQPCML